MCKELDLITCTEGIENALQANLLTAHGCDQAQGYFFGRPQLLTSVNLRADPDKPTLRVLDLARGLPSCRARCP